MFVAKCNDTNHIYTGSEIKPLINESYYPTIEYDFRCPICDKEVRYNDLSGHHLFESFIHRDGTSDCFEDESISGGHRIAVELAVKALHNRISEITSKQVEINVEKWIGTRPNFVIADVKITSPLQIAAEIYYKASKLALYRRLRTMFSNGYSAYLIFHIGGRHNVNRIESYIRKIATLKIGRFDPETMELTFGDLFTREQVNLNQHNRKILPEYIQ